MHIAWITPFSQRSAIGLVTAAVVRRLSERGHDVTVIRSELDPPSMPPIPVPVPVVDWQSPEPVEADVYLVNLGDHFDYHAGVLAMLERYPCIGVFHDYYLYNFFHGWCAYHGVDMARHHDIISDTYGDGALLPARQAWERPNVMDQIATTIPMTEWLARHCAGALAHSNFYRPRLESACPGPVAVAPLPVRSPGTFAAPATRADTVTITTVGHMNANKCADVVIQAIGRSEMLRAGAEYRLAGSITDNERERLTALARNCGVTRIDILGEVSEEELVREFERADILSCLRRPVLEGASASTIEGMKSGRPVVVPDAGFYTDLADDLVFKVPAAVTPHDVQQVLERLAADPALRTETGARARDWANQTFTADRYIDALETLMHDYLRARPLHELTGRLGRMMQEIGVRPGTEEAARIARAMQGLFQPAQAAPAAAGAQESST